MLGLYLFRLGYSVALDLHYMVWVLPAHDTAENLQKINVLLEWNLKDYDIVLVTDTVIWLIKSKYPSFIEIMLVL